TSPIIKEVEGPDSENINIAFRFKGAGSKDSDILMLLDMILSNSTAGLIDLNLVQKQKVLSATSGVWELKDYSLELLSGKPKENQTLQEVKDLLLEQVELIKKGEFTDWLIPAIINDLKLMQMKSYEDNNSRASAFVNAFVMGIPWENKVTLFERLSKITKQEVIDFAKANFTEKNYVVVYKKTGTDKSIVKIKKPKITPIKINRTDQSTFYKTIESSKVPDVEPVFLDYSKDIATLKAKSNIELLYKENTENKTFDLIYVFKMGNNNSKKWGIALKYLEYLGTSKYTAEEIKQEFYKIACTYKISVGDEETYLNISGLSENIDRAFELFESILSEPKADKASLDNFISDIIKKRKDAKLNKQNIQMALRSYGIWGPNGPFKNKLSEAELKTLTPEELVAIIKEANSYEHHILYYGSHSKDEIINLVNIYHKVPAVLTAVPLATKFVQQPTDKNIIYHVDFAMKQADIFMLNRGGLYDKSTEATVNLFNEYFGGSMNSIVFQELREARALAYTAQSVYSKPKYLDRYYYSFSYIGTQTDKLAEAMNGLLDLMNKMPEAEKSFEIAKSSIIQQMRTERITKSDVLYSYESARKLGLNYDIRKDVFTQLPKLTFADIKAFEEKNLKDKPHTTLILADKKILDFKLLKKYGKVKYLKLEDVFGY
ncbi:MAG: insulinase family protein, partial [Bacteroidetes bacterium]|nr:insulinase family protein [Bacteroidota bacterium]